ncbi:hypothetical protein G4228_001458 [Cervus hanglu yarkandensis]|nr:hypothetical protein G4228_001458 [Cervus hanglu yarkandensis]
MATTICFIIWVLFVTDTVWTRSVRQVYEASDPEDWTMHDFDCPRECFCPPSFPTALYCENRGLKEIPAIPSRIWYLYLENNLIETIPEKPFENATQLRWINLNKNKITNYGIEKGALSQLKKLLFLFLEDNELEEVPSPLPRSLEQLQLARNKVSRIPQGTFSNLENLTLLDLQHNKLLDNAFQRDTFKGLKNLMQLNMAKNALRNMPPRLPANTMQLFLDNNSIEGIPENYFNVIPKVAFLRLNHNKLSDAGLPSSGFNVSSILDLQLSHNQLTKVPKISAHLQHLHLDHNKIRKSINYDSENYDATLEDLDHLYSYENIPVGRAEIEIATVMPSGNRELLTPPPQPEEPEEEEEEESTPRLIDGSSPQEPEFTGVLGPQTNEDDLRRIDLTSNLISEIDEDAFRKLPQLRELVLRDNKIRQLPELPTTLRFIDISNNRLGRKGIKQEAFKDMYDLHHLYLTDNNLDHIPLPLPENLRALHLQNNNILEMHEDTFCNVKNLTYIRKALEDIRLDGNPINLSKTPQAYMCLPRLPIGSLV